MLVKTISFDIHNFTTSETEEFVIQNTIENQELVFGHRYTRNIKLTEMFNFEFERRMRMPIEFISELTWLRIVSANPELAQAVAELETVN